jgi:hypothetical protein
MHYANQAGKLELDPLSKFLKEMGLTTHETIPSLKITRSGLPDELKVVVLEVSGS